MNPKEPVHLFWFRRDLRLNDNHGLLKALETGIQVIGLFIFDSEILDLLKDRADSRVSFIRESLENLNADLKHFNTSLLVRIGSPAQVFKDILSNFQVKAVFTNHDYEPYATERDALIKELLFKAQIPFHTFKDQVIFEKEEIVKDDGKPYTVFSPYKRKWLLNLQSNTFQTYPVLDLVKKGQGQFYPYSEWKIPSFEELGFTKSPITFPDKHYADILGDYEQKRNFPALRGTSRVSVHLRFGTLSIRELARIGQSKSETWLSELIWRDFYSMILWHFPKVQKAFRPEYDRIPWRVAPEDFKKWCVGETGYPIVDAGMRELNATGFMHNRVRMVVASFLTKHLLIDWRLGEAYFAEKLIDFDLSSNNGGWQWASGSGVDAAPYFRIFNPYEQEKKFDPDHIYIRKWVQEWNTSRYPVPIVDHKFARARCLETYQKALKNL